VSDDDWLDADSAAALLGIRKATLYSYVSRGRVRARTLPGTRHRRYARVDLERLRVRRDARKGHGAVAAGALRWGEPVLDTALSDVAEGELRYRGRPPLPSTFEDTATLLWSGLHERRGFPARAVLPPEARPLLEGREVATALRRATPLLPGEPEAIVAGLVEALSIAYVRSAGAGTIAARLARVLGLRATAPRVEAIDEALVLCAEHGLNASSFAARVAASAGASLDAAVSAALATLTGDRHGGMVPRIEAFLGSFGSVSEVVANVRRVLDEGGVVPGFGHPLYPAGDPRTPPLLERAASLGGRATAPEVFALVDAMALAGAGAPTVDYGLVALARALELPEGGAFALFAIGRSAGWIAHALEQREQGFLLRPRARYVG